MCGVASAGVGVGIGCIDWTLQRRRVSEHLSRIDIYAPSVFGGHSASLFPLFQCYCAVTICPAGEQASGQQASGQRRAF